jgi:RimJ/RimL family protein N-acetyltransferase
MPSFPVPAGPLTDGVVALRLSAERDIPEVLIAYQDDPRLAGSLGERRPPSGAALGSRAEDAAVKLEAGRAVVFTILEADGDVCLGEVRVDEVDWRDRRARLTVWVAPASRGRGYAGRSARLARGWLSQSCGIEATCSRTE